jgi:hypothetical protein
MTSLENMMKDLDERGVLHNHGWTVNAVGKGWAPIVTALLQLCNHHGVVVTQVKEKFGTLRFYVGGAPDWIHSLIDYAEAATAHVCESCGLRNNAWLNAEKGYARVRLRMQGWMTTACDDCERAAHPEDPDIDPVKEETE